MDNGLKERSLSAQMLGRFSAAIIVVGILSIIFVYEIGEIDAEARAYSKLDAIAAYLAGTVQLPLWNFDLDTVRYIGETVTQDITIADVEILDQEGNILYAKHGPAGSRGISTSRKIIWESKSIGEIRVAIDIDPFKAAHYETIRLALFFLVLLIAIAVIMFRALLRRHLRASFAALEQIIRRYAAGDYRPTERESPYLEFKPMTQVLESMGATILGQIDELQSYQHGLEEQVQQRTLELEISEEKYRDLYDNSPALMISVDVSTRKIIECNETVSNQLGYSRDEVIGRNLFELYHPDSVVAAKKVFETFLAEDEVRNAELQLIRKDGEIVDVLLDVTARTDERTGRKYTLSIWRDITERKRLEDKLLQAKNEAEEANQAKSTFLANMSHELRTPLNAVLGFSELLTRDAEVSERQKESLDLIRRSGQHLLSLINDVLDMSKIEAGRLDLELAPTNLNDLLEDMAEMVRVRAESKKLKSGLEYEQKGQRTLMLDVGKLRQVLINLLDNAIKHTSSGSIVLRCHQEEFEGNRTRLKFEVEDTGIGIAQEDIATIFEPFKQADANRIPHSGTGLGLAICYQFVKLMGGTISVESTPQLGSTFRFEIPAEITENDETIVVRRQRVVRLAEDSPECRVLIVDDEPNNRMLLTRLLENAGFLVRRSVNGDDAISEFRDWQPDLIWMDMRMPVMDGYEATRRIRELPGGEAVKIIALTASAFKEQNDKILAAGCDGIVHKPYVADTIFSTMLEYLDLRYVYDDETETTDNNALPALQHDELRELPKEWTLQFLGSVRVGDIDGALVALDGLAKSHASIQGKLRIYIQMYAIESLVAALEDISDPASGQ